MLEGGGAFGGGDEGDDGAAVGALMATSLAGAWGAGGLHALCPPSAKAPMSTQPRGEAWTGAVHQEPNRNIRAAIDFLHSSTSSRLTRYVVVLARGGLSCASHGLRHAPSPHQWAREAMAETNCSQLSVPSNVQPTGTSRASS